MIDEIIASKFQKGLSLIRSGEGHAACRVLEPLLNFLPDERDLLFLIGIGYSMCGRYQKAIEKFDQLLKRFPLDANLYINKGIALRKSRKLNDAISCFDRAIDLNPNGPEAHCGKANVLRELGMFSEAIEEYKIAIKYDPRNADAYNNLGLAYVDLHLFEKAVSAYNEALTLTSNAYDIAFNRSLALLAVGNYFEGWRAYESRLQTERRPRVFDKPVWLGREDITNKVILLHSEQGLGDTLQFVRYVNLVAQRCRRVLLLVQKPLAGICRTLASQPLVFTDGDALPDFHVHCPIMSLPLALDTRVESIPAGVPYLHSDQAEVAYWREKIGLGSGLKVGLVWSGGSYPDNSEMWSINHRRNIALEKLKPLAVPGVQFFSLQKGLEAESELRRLKELNWSGPEVTDFVNELNDYVDTAALIENLDLVISVDTSVVHLTGALAKPVWILNRFDSCWRWFADRADSPWYPTARIYNQSTPGDWDFVVESVRRDLIKLAEAKE